MNTNNSSIKSVRPIISAGRLSVPGVVALLSFVWIFHLSGKLPPGLFHIGLDNVWFDADIPRYICQMVDRVANDHWRNKVHPLFSLLSYPGPKLLTLFQIDIVTAMRMQIALAASIGMGFLFAALKRVGLGAVDAALLTALALTSSTALVWFSVAESYAYTFTAFAIVLYLSARDTARDDGSRAPWVAAAAFAFSITVTNLAVALLGAVQARGVKRAIRLAIMAVAVVGVLAVLQRLVFPKSGLFFLPAAVQEETSFFVRLSVDRVRQVLALFYFGSVVFPDVARNAMSNGETVLTVQHASWRQGGWPAYTGLLLIALMMAPGVASVVASCKRQLDRLRGGVAIATPRWQDGLRVTVAGSLAFLTTLHLVYGKETFVYAGSVLPMLIMLLAFGALTLSRHSRAATTAMLACLLAASATHNIARWEAASADLRARNGPISAKALGRSTCSFVKQQP
ncbi:DUF6080 domain-containing protein [Pseudoduganella namucuonensis]|uniref:Glycosyltransferase RgtA/B/C/D-like domain-containing protein n=1 Tax=Pseudoduganella namucuonensis TaxID=1035707 RepID=A0A1I7GF83_9BURK|nr:DUF6080 domain-containing protein [Pseudoduganella namucuonensis]SFU47090.1 hypothetical protein SAMN05216552_1003282 [Pseudoduganella namucuonensis]